MTAEQAFLGVLDPRNPRDGRDDLIFVLPRIRAVIRAKHVAPDDLEILTKFILHFALPLEGQIGGRDDKRAFDQAANLQFFEQQTGHDGFARAGVVGQQEANSRQCHEILINRFKLMRERVNARNGKRKVRVVLKRQREPHGFDGETEAQRVAVERFGVRGGFQGRQLVGSENGLVHARGGEALGDKLHGGAHGNTNDDLNRFGENRPAQNLVGLQVFSVQ